NIPPIIVGSQNATDNMTISKVFLAVDKENFYIKLDIADNSPSSFFHPHNFDAMHDSPSYGVTIDTGDSGKNLSVRLFHSEGEELKHGWLVQIGVRERETFRKIDYVDQYEMRGSSVEISLPLPKIKGFLSDLSQTKEYRILGWTAKGGVPTSETSARAAITWSNALKDLKETEAGYFTF